MSLTSLLFVRCDVRRDLARSIVSSIMYTAALTASRTSSSAKLDPHVERAHYAPFVQLEAAANVQMLDNHLPAHLYWHFNW